MTIRHRIEQGDSIAKLSERYGFAPETIWDHPDNASLKALRKNMNVLAPGDVVAVPDREEGVETCATGKRHTFQRAGVPMLFRMQLLAAGEPRKNQPYVLHVDGQQLEGSTDGEGRIERYLPNGARQGRLIVSGGAVDLRVLFGHMDPIGTTPGVQKRLRNMGFDCGDEDGEIGPRTVAATRLFQFYCGLPATGELDDATRDKIATCHDEPNALKEAMPSATGA